VYSRDLLRLGLRLAEQGRLSDPDGSAEVRSRACGSVVIADVRLEDGCVVAFGQEVKACAVGQASAAILGEHLYALSRSEVLAARTLFENYLNGLRDDLGVWPEMQMLAGVRAHKGRHAAALLPYDAFVAAIDQAVSRSRNVATSES
jgi:NifU-like protein involved in Fe-S cluster formation